MARQKGSAAVIILGVVILIGLVFGAYYLRPTKVTTGPQALPTSIVSIQKEAWRTYKNSKYGYAVDYPADWTLREFPDTQTGAGFKPPDNENEVITIDAMGMVLDDRGVIPFSEYVKTAAKNEIQNYKSLATIKEVVTSSGLTGYETTWNVASLRGPAYVSSPRTYFPLPEKYGQKTLQFTLDFDNYADVYHKMLDSVTYEVR